MPPFQNENQSHFHKNGFAVRLALKQRHEGTQKWPVPIIGFSLPYKTVRILIFQSISNQFKTLEKRQKLSLPSSYKCRVRSCLNIYSGEQQERMDLLFHSFIFHWLPVTQANMT